MIDDRTWQFEKPDIVRPGCMVNLETRERYSFGVTGSLRIGRETQNDIVLSDVYASSYHAVITLQPDACMLTDLNSRNGTLHNDKPVTEPVRLAREDTITIGRTKFTFE